mmetsp:Transcript_13230/g.32472  ORF Transcript_13230/g.32472 Transcript_13230/m.32472 type:complete len:96 (-) Transcript_13230:394-681(-)
MLGTNRHTLLAILTMVQRVHILRIDYSLAEAVAVDLITGTPKYPSRTSVLISIPQYGRCLDSGHTCMASLRPSQKIIHAHPEQVVLDARNLSGLN